MPRPPYTRFPKDSPLAPGQRSELTKAFNKGAASKGQSNQVTVVPGNAPAGITPAQLALIINEVTQNILSMLVGLGLTIDCFDPNGLGPYPLSAPPLKMVGVFTDAGFEPPAAPSTPANFTVVRGVMNFVSGYDTTTILKTVACMYIAAL